jgi:hypothetical protein
MKKIIFSLVLCLCAGFSAMAQDLAVVVEEDASSAAFVNKRGISLLPKAGDYAIGVDATPFLQYLGNFFNKDNNTAPLFNGVDNTIYGKYFLEDNRAIRAKLRLNAYKDQNKGTVINDYEVANNPLNPYATTVDVRNTNTYDVDLFAGYEFRRGRGRVQGFWGAEAGFGFGKGTQKYEYGNPITNLNQTPSSIFGTSPITGRTTEVSYGTELRATIAGFVGVEYFFAPQISIGGEFNLAFLYAYRGQDEITSEKYDSASDQIQTINRRYRYSGDLAGAIGLQTKPTGSIFLMFHF